MIQSMSRAEQSRAEQSRAEQSSSGLKPSFCRTLNLSPYNMCGLFMHLK